MNPTITSGTWYEYTDTIRFPIAGVNILLFGSANVYSSTQNAGQLYGGVFGQILRGGTYNDGNKAGIFGANLAWGPTNLSNSRGFRCVYNPPPLAGTVSGMAPEITGLGRVTDLDNFMENSPVTVANGGSWNLKWAVKDTETSNSSLVVEVRRKIANSATDFPISSDSIYLSGTGATLTKLHQETAWASVAEPNNNKFVNYLITVQDTDGNITSSTFSVTNTSSCPSGYEGVPGNATVGLGNPSATIGNVTPSLDPSRAFCVMKYPAKNVSGVAASVVSGVPWVNGTRNSAATSCSNLGSGFGLMSNTQWQVVARNAESVALNWSGGAVGTGVLNRGHTDNSPNSILGHSLDDNDGYLGTGNTGFTAAAWSGMGAAPAAGAEQKRTFHLSNGVVLWDFAGNVWHWVNDDYSSLGMSPGIGADWSQFSNTTDFPPGGVNRLNFAPLGSFTTSQNAGQLYGGSSGAVIRGGNWYDGTNIGIFSAATIYGTTTNRNDVGFRCIYNP